MDIIRCIHCKSKRREIKPSKKVCVVCIGKQTIRSSNLRQGRIAKGLCRLCGEEPVLMLENGKSRKTGEECLRIQRLKS